MHIVVFAILLLGQSDALDSYHLSIDQVYLDSLYDHPFDDLQFPAFIETEMGACSCLAGFRGGTSLWCSKKSWKMELEDSSLINGTHLLLDAQYRDLTLMRNSLALWLTDRMGRPSPETRHVELYMNGEYYGVYVQAERVDEYFLQRNGIGDGPIFKSVSHEGRLVWQPSDSTLSTGFELKQGCEDQFSLVRRLVDQVNLGLPFSVDVADWITYMAISLAIYDKDALTKNYYLHLTPYGEWRFYPWDRDASFGNEWDGTYDPTWVSETTTFTFSISPMTHRLLLDGENRDLLEESIEDLSDVMRYELPGMIDSIAVLIRPSLEADPFRQGTMADFDEAVAVLMDAVQVRGEFLPEIAEGHHPIEPVSVVLDWWELPVGHAQQVTVTSTWPQPVSDITLVYCIDDGNPTYTWMQPGSGDGTVWFRTVTLWSTAEHIQFAVRTGIGDDDGPNSVFSWPLYGLATFPDRRVAAPTARRSGYPFIPDDLEVLAPVRYTPFLWSLPLVNTGEGFMDLAYFGFQTGNPPARAFAGEEMLLGDGDTLYLTNCRTLLHLVLPGRRIIGDLVLETPSGSELTIMYPSWSPAITGMVSDEVPCVESGETVVLSEVCTQGGTTPGDWIELYNPGAYPAYLGGCVLMDGQAHSFDLPPGLSVEPGDYLLICADSSALRPFCKTPVQMHEIPDLGLNSEQDGVTLFQDEDLLFTVNWDSISWPILPGHVLSLLSPSLPESSPANWSAVEMPGTPGAPNPSWPQVLLGPVITSLYPNPTAAAFSIDYSVPHLPSEIMVYDITGRLAQRPIPISDYQGSMTIEVSPSLPAGVYFAVIRSIGTCTASKFLLLP